MKLIDKGHKHPPFDVSSGLAEVLLAIAPNHIERFVPPAPKRKAASGEWTAHPPRRRDSGQFAPPCIEVNCTGCNANLHYEGLNPASMVIRHLAACEASGQAEVCPKEIAEQYLADRSTFYARRKTGEKSALQQLREDLKFQVRTI